MKSTPQETPQNLETLAWDCWTLQSETLPGAAAPELLLSTIVLIALQTEVPESWQDISTMGSMQQPVSRRDILEKVSKMLDLSILLARGQISHHKQK